MNQQTQLATSHNDRRAEIDTLLDEPFFSYENDLLAQFDGWSGEAVADLSVDTLKDYPEWASSDRLSSTVPEAYRGQVDGPKLPCSETNSLATVQESFEVLAVDLAGNALTRKVFTFAYEDADWMSYSIMPKDEAIAVLTEFRSMPTNGSIVGAEPGKDYSGPILRVTKECVFQQVGDQIVEHERSMLVSGSLDASDGGYHRLSVEIRYGQGDAGIVTVLVAARHYPEL